MEAVGLAAVPQSRPDQVDRRGRESSLESAQRSCAGSCHGRVQSSYVLKGICLLDLRLPARHDWAVQEQHYGKLVMEPFEPGFALTVGIAYRRVLLSAIHGAAPTWVKIEHVLHEFSHLPGVTEDTLDIMMTLRKVAFVLHVNRPKVLRLKAEGPGTVRASDFEKDADIEILTPEVRLATLDKGGVLEMEVCVERGRGYVPAEKREPEALPIHAILLDADFSPVKRVNFHVEPAVDGRQRLVLEVWTDGSVAPSATRRGRGPSGTRTSSAASTSSSSPSARRIASRARTSGPSPTSCPGPRPSCSRRRTSARNRSTRSRRSSGRWVSRSACAWIPRSSSGCALNTERAGEA